MVRLPSPLQSNDGHDASYGLPNLESGRKLVVVAIVVNEQICSNLALDHSRSSNHCSNLEEAVSTKQLISGLNSE